MTEAKFTPGPWTHYDQGIHPYPFVCGSRRTVEGDRFVVAYLVGLETEANARLIAAAPDLYDAARKLAAEVGGLKAFEYEIRAAIGNTNWSLLMQRLDEAAAAIAKAKAAPTP